MLLFLLEKEKSNVKADMLFCSGGLGIVFLFCFLFFVLTKIQKYRFFYSSCEHFYKYFLNTF